ncbi:MAG: hypothetical protein ACFB0B_15125 [Thermonemataceae bacterium]
MENITTLVTLVQKDFQLDHLEAGTSLQDFREQMIVVIEELLLDNVEQLIQGAYRIDLDEEHFTTALHQQNAMAIADLIIDRETKKIALRKKYRIS